MAVIVVKTLLSIESLLLRLSDCQLAQERHIGQCMRPRLLEARILYLVCQIHADRESSVDHIAISLPLLFHDTQNVSHLVIDAGKADVLFELCCVWIKVAELEVWRRLNLRL